MKNREDIQAKNPFRVPDNYFEEVNRKIISRTAGKETEVKKPGLYRKLRPYILAAASVTGFVILSYSVTRYLSDRRTDTTNVELYADTLIDPFFNDLDLMTIEENAGTIELSEVLTGIRKSEIIDYLMLENIEPDDIYEEL